jgi:hypothetical protein
VASQLAVAHIERLVLHEQPDHLAVGYVDDGATGLGVGVPGLWICQRPHSIEPSQVAARQAEGFALIEISPQTDMPIGQREHRLRLREPLQAQFRLTQPPGFSRKVRVPDHASANRSGTAWLRLAGAACKQ